MMNGEPVVLAGYQITTSDERGLPRGTLVMARELDAAGSHYSPPDRSRYQSEPGAWHCQHGFDLVRRT